MSANADNVITLLYGRQDMDDEPGDTWKGKIGYMEISDSDFEPSIEQMADLQNAFDKSNGPTPSLNKADYVVLYYLFAKTADVPSNIAEGTGYNRTYIHQRLTRLEEWGIVKNRGHGVYELNHDTIDIVRSVF